MEREEIRENMLKTRGSIDADSAASKSEKIKEHLSELDLYKNADTILCYASYKSEVDTFPILKMAIEDGKALYCPRVVGKNMVFLRIYAVEELQTGYNGIPEPFFSDAFSPIIGEKKALCIMPGVAFDKAKNRLGYGGGFYDRYLSVHGEFVNTVALGYDFQILDEIPTEPFDIKPDVIITDKEIIE